jgi:CRP-like cAMP-binding protein
MSETTGLQTTDLSSIPLFRDFTDEQLASVVELCERVEGDVTDIFIAGEPAENIYILTGGEVVLTQDGEDTHNLKPPVIIGELGALTGRTRNSGARVAAGSVLWRLRVNRLLETFETKKDLGLAFQLNLMHIVADKIDRDQRRLADMRANIITTQKAMKRMRTFLLESDDTVVSQELHSTIENLIKQNRRANYRVEPPAALPATLRLGEATAGIVQISRTHISCTVADGDLPKAGDRITGVLHLTGPEIPVSGKVLRTLARRVDIELDLLLEDYAATLEGYLTRLQMLDFLV